MPDSKKVGAIMRLLPDGVREKALWDYESFKDSPAKLRQLLKDKAKIFTKGNFGSEGRKRVNLFNAHELDNLTQEAVNYLEQMDDAEICACVKKRFVEKGPGPREAPPRDARDVRCSNC